VCHQAPLLVSLFDYIIDQPLVVSGLFIAIDAVIAWLLARCVSLYFKSNEAVTLETIKPDSTYPATVALLYA